MRLLDAPYSEVDREQILSELARVTGSEPFLRSPSSQRLLRFLVEQELAGEGGSLKESYIGHAHYRRAPDYDTKNDALVRVNVKRLRVSLDAYYEGESPAVIRIEIPRGSYIPRYALQVEEVAPGDKEHVAGGTETDVTAPRIEAEPFPVPPESGTTFGGREMVLQAVAAPVMVRRRPGAHLFLGAMAVVLILGSVVATLFWRKAQASQAQTTWIAQPFLRPEGLATFPDYSPDGTRVAFSWAEDPSSDHSEIVVEDLRTRSLTRLDIGKPSSTRPVWSPGGEAIAFLSSDGDRKEIRVTSLRDHATRTIAPLTGSFPWLCQVPRLSWTGDGKHILTADSAGSSAPCRIVSVDVATGAKQVLSDEAAGVIGDVEPAVSPDGKQIAFLRNTGVMVGDLYVMDLDGKDLHRVTWDGRDVMGFCWNGPDYRFILASRRGDGTLRLWETGGQPGTFTRLTDGLTSVGFPARSPDGRSILFASYRNSSSVWRIWADGRNPEELITNDSVNADPKTSPDGSRIAFRSDQSGASEIWIAGANGQHPRQLTSLNGPAINHLSWSPDGKQIAFDCRDSGHTNLCLISIATGRITHPVDWTSNQERPFFSADGKYLYFISTRSGTDAVYRLALGQTEPEVLPGGEAIRVAEGWKQPTLLLARFHPVDAIYAEGATPISCEHCAPEEPLLRMDEDRLRNAWDAAPGGFWYVGDRAEDGYAPVYRYSLTSHRSNLIARLRHTLVAGDPSLAVEPGGESALVVVQGPQAADLYTLRSVN